MKKSKSTTSEGCQFTLFPMSDDFVKVILSALDEVDTTNISMQTDDVSTFIQGETMHLFDVTQAIFLQAASTGAHVAMSGTFSVGCAGEHDKNIHAFKEGALLNKKKMQHISQQAACKIALYPMGSDNYIDVINEQLGLARKENVKVSADHYSTRLDGDVNDIFKIMELFFTNTKKEVQRLSLTFTISANSPSKKEGGSND